ncbi:MAG TPA: DUF2127 domain-containing protein [Polyangiaceae bacterium]|nr:DUF2127 domain-containing protein [Polyangiaceae bacterium]
MKRERGVALIIAYKLVKAGLWFVLAATIVVMMQLGLGDKLLGLAQHLRLHAHPWSLALADLAVKASSRRSLWKITFALLADGSLTLLEGWSLLHGRWWGPWLVVVATGSLIPFEVLSIARHVHLVRIVVLIVNVVIVVYLARKAVREAREARERGRERVPPVTRPEPRGREPSVPPREALPPA